MDGLLEKKAILTLGGGVRLPEGYVVPCRISRSTAGPGAGFGSVAFYFGGYRVKKSISYDSGEFELHVSDDGKLSLTRNGEPFLDEIELQPVVRHCPEQAFFNLDPRCMYHCAYCSSPLLDMKDDKHLSTEKIMEMLKESVERRRDQAQPGDPAQGHIREGLPRPGLRRDHGTPQRCRRCVRQGTCDLQHHLRARRD